MKKFIVGLSIISCATAAHAEWSLRPYAQINAGLDSTTTSKTGHEVGKRIIQAIDPLAPDYLYRTNVAHAANIDTKKSTVDFGANIEVGGEFRYKWFYSAISFGYDLTTESSFNARLGGTYGNYTPYLKLGALLSNGYSVGTGLSYKLGQNIFLEFSYDMSKYSETHKGGTADAPYEHMDVFAPGSTDAGKLSSIEVWKSLNFIFLPDEYWLTDFNYKEKMTTHSFKTGIKYVF